MKKNHKIILGLVLTAAAIWAISSYMKKEKAKKMAAAAAAAASTKGATDPSTATPGIVAKTSIMNNDGVTTAKEITG